MRRARFHATLELKCAERDRGDDHSRLWRRRHGKMARRDRGRRAIAAYYATGIKDLAVFEQRRYG
jgi:hypothetical protein